MFSFESPALDVKSLALKTKQQRSLAYAIAQETETQRVVERSRYLQSLQAAGQAMPQGLLGEPYDYTESLRWDLLLTFGNCAERCAERVGIGHLEVIDFAMNHCAPSEPWLLFWYREAQRAILRSVDADLHKAEVSRELEEAHAKHQRIKEGARIGGEKSAVTRRKAQSTPSGAVLRAERQTLIDRGCEERSVTGVLARKYNVTPGAIRAAYKRD